MISKQEYFNIIFERSKFLKLKGDNEHNFRKNALNEKRMSNDEVEELIDDAEEVARKIATDSKRDEDEIETAKEVIQFVKDVRKTFIKNGSIHPNTLNSLSRITTGVNSGRFGFMNKTSPKVPADYSK